MTHLTIGRILLIIGIIIGLKSWSMTIQHVGDPTYMLISEFTKGDTHAWYHAFREAIGDLAAMATILVVFFGGVSHRTPITWYICLLLMVGYYAPFWIGTPFIPELAAPHIKAEMIHILMAFFPTVGLFVSRSEFFKVSKKINKGIISF